MALPRILGFSSVAAIILISAAYSQTPEIQRLHDALHLTSQQENAWHTFQTATQISPEEALRRRRAAEMMPSLSAPQRVDLSVAAMQADLQSFQRRGIALKTFYAILTPEQQTVFDHMTTLQQQ
jgi:protein CpxP